MFATAFIVFNALLTIDVWTWLERVREVERTEALEPCPSDFGVEPGFSVEIETLPDWHFGSSGVHCYAGPRRFRYTLGLVVIDWPACH